jgi:TatD DNase family protein
MIRSKKGRKIVERAPRNRVLTETDGPHLKIGKRPATPADVAHVLRHLAEVWSTSPPEAQRLVRSNLNRILNPIRQWKDDVSSLR